jgi:hypothetical protein
LNNYLPLLDLQRRNKTPMGTFQSPNDQRRDLVLFVFICTEQRTRRCKQQNSVPLVNSLYITSAGRNIVIFISFKKAFYIVVCENNKLMTLEGYYLHIFKHLMGYHSHTLYKPHSVPITVNTARTLRTSGILCQLCSIPLVRSVRAVFQYQLYKCHRSLFKQNCCKFI